jgi:hypothetical protein
LHREFETAGAEVMITAGQACVLYGIAAFSKDGDWIIRESKKHFQIVLEVLAKANAVYRLGAPLDLRWHRQGWSSHFEFTDGSGFRVRADFLSRPPRVRGLKNLWKNAVSQNGLRIIDPAALMATKATQRAKDYPIIGALAQSTGLKAGKPDLALAYLQDYDRLRQAVKQWPRPAASSGRPAVRLAVSGASRAEIVAALAQEQDARMREDRARLEARRKKMKGFDRCFSLARKKWAQTHTGLMEQHREILGMAGSLLE